MVGGLGQQENANPNLPHRANPGPPVVGGTKMRGGQSSLDTPVPIPAIDVKKVNRFKDIVNDDGSRRTTTFVDLNLCWQQGQEPRHIGHFPVAALVRELHANAIDAGFEGNQHTWNGLPAVQETNSLLPLAGFTALNGHLAASWTVSIEKVKKNPKYEKQRKDTADLPPKYIEIAPPKKKRAKKKIAKGASRKRSRRDDDDDDGEGEGNDDGGDDDDSDYEGEEGEDDNAEEEQQDAGGWDADDFNDETCFWRVALYIRSFSLLLLEAWVNAFSSKNNVSSDVLW